MTTPPLPAGYQLIPAAQAAPPPLPAGYRMIPEAGPGEQINDVGNKVIVPAEGESFDQTMQRAAAYGKTVTPGQINAELRTAPVKATETLAAAPLLGAAGAASLAGTGELLLRSPQIAKNIAEHVKQPGTILKMPYGRAVEYYLLGKLGVSKETLAKMAAMF